MAQPKRYPWTRRRLYHENFFKVFPPYRRNRFCLSAVFTNTPSAAWQWKVFPSEFPDVETFTRAGPKCICRLPWGCVGAFVVVFRFICVQPGGWRVGIVWAGWGGCVLKRKGGRKSESNSAHQKNRSSICAERHECTFQLFRANFLWVGIGLCEEVFPFSAFCCVHRQSACIRWSIFWGNLSFEFFMTLDVSRSLWAFSIDCSRGI